MSAFAAVVFTVAASSLAVGSARAARVLERPLALPAYGRPALACALAISIFFTATALAGRAAGSFDFGLCAAALAGLLLCAVAFAARVERSPAAAIGSRLAFLAALSVIGALYAYLSARYQMHDEHAIFGHKSMVENLRHGLYPPHAPPLPEVEVRYHYGFDLLAGALARAYGLSADRAIDLATVFFALFMSVAAAAVVSAASSSASAPFAALVIHLGAGLAALLLAGVPGRHPRCLIQYHHPSCDVELFPTQLLNVFQHPVSAGVPLLLVFAMLVPALLARQRSAAIGVALVLLPALALAQVVYFSLGVAAFVAILIVQRPPRAVWARSGFLLAAAGVLAYLQGGMFAPATHVQPGLIATRWPLGFPPGENIFGILWHHLVNLGVGFALIPYFAWILLKRDRRVPALFLLAFGCGGILAAHLYTYTRSWDIVKFPSAASFALVMVYAATTDVALAAHPWPRRLGRLLVCGTGVLAALYLLFPLRREVRPYELGEWKADPIVQQAVDWFHANGYDHRELIYTQSNVAPELAIAGGLSVVAQDADLYYLGVKDAILHEQTRRAHELRASMSKAALSALKVRWVVLSDEELANLGPAARAALEDRARFAVAAEFPGDPPRRRRRIFRVLD